MKSFSGFVANSDHFRPACLLRAALAFDLIVMMHIELGKLPRYTRTELVLVIISEPFSKKKVYWGWLTGKDGCETKLRMNLEFQWHRCWWKIRNTLKTQLLCQMWEAQGLQKRRRQNGIAWLVSPSAHSKHAGQCHCYERESSWASSYAWVQGLQDINQTVWAFWVRNDNGFHWKTGDEGGISDVTVEELTKEVLPVLLASYQPNDIFSCDEIAMFFKVLLNCTYNLKGKKCIYRKTTEELVAALLCSDTDGSEKMSPLVMLGTRVQNVSQITSLFHVHTSTLQRHGWHPLFLKHLWKWDALLRIKNRKV